MRFSRELYDALRKSCGTSWAGFGLVKEYPPNVKAGWGDIDSGPVVLGVSFSGTGFTIAGARAHGDYRVFRALYRTSYIVGAPLYEDRHPDLRLWRSARKRDNALHADCGRRHMNRKWLLRLATEFLVLLALNLAGLYAMAHWRVMESILSPGPHSVKLFAGLAVMFVIVRLFLILAAPGWFLARLMLAVAEPCCPAAVKSAGPARTCATEPFV